MRKLTTEQFILKARKVHGDMYSYKNAMYNGYGKPITVTCPTHGDFITTARLHLGGCKCPKCTGNRPQMNTEEFIIDARKVHGDLYDYSKVNYIKSIQKVEIICPKHGSFFVTPNNHISKKVGCPLCSREQKALTTEQFIEKAKAIHNDKYDYSRVLYNNNREKVEIICPIHGSFFTSPYVHLSKKQKGCPKCGARRSRGEEELKDFISKYVQVESNNRTILNGKEIDIYCPSKKIGFEYNGLFWHSEIGNRTSLLYKTEKCEEQDIQLIHIFEDEWIHKKQIVKSRIRHLLGITAFGKIYARKCEVRCINSSLSKKFVEKYHLQGAINASVHLGLFYKNRLVAVMTFGKSRFNKKYGWELLRYCTISNFSVVGGAGKLLKFFLRQTTDSIVTYADRRWSNGNLYRQLGFKFVRKSPPGYTYFNGANGIERLSRIKFQKHKLKSILSNYDPNLSESENMKNNGWVKIYDCGNFTFEI